MPTFLKIPLEASTTDQSISVELGENPYLLRILWNERFSYHSISISTVDEEPLLINIKMVKNYPLIGRFKDSRLPKGELYFVQESGPPTDKASYDQIGVTWGLYFYAEDSEAAALPPLLSTEVFDTIGSFWDNGNSLWDDRKTLWDL